MMERLHLPRWIIGLLALAIVAGTTVGVVVDPDSFMIELASGIVSFSILIVVGIPILGRYTMNAEARLSSIAAEKIKRAHHEIFFRDEPHTHTGSPGTNYRVRVCLENGVLKGIRRHDLNMLLPSDQALRLWRLLSWLERSELGEKWNQPTNLAFRYPDELIEELLSFFRDNESEWASLPDKWLEPSSHLTNWDRVIRWLKQ